MRIISLGAIKENELPAFLYKPLLGRNKILKSGRGSKPDLTGQRFRNFVVIRKADKERIPHYFTSKWWVVECDYCKKELLFTTSALRQHSKSNSRWHPGCSFQRPQKRKYSDFSMSAKLSYFAQVKHDNLVTKKKQRAWELSFAQFISIVSKPCKYCGIQYSKTVGTEKYGNFRCNGIDRIDSKKAYIFENCVSSCKDCNYAKNVKTEEEFKLWLIRAYKHLIQENAITV